MENVPKNTREYQFIRTGAGRHTFIRFIDAKLPRIDVEERQSFGQSPPRYMGWTSARKLRRWLDSQLKKSKEK